MMFDALSQKCDMITFFLFCLFFLSHIYTALFSFTKDTRYTHLLSSSLIFSQPYRQANNDTTLSVLFFIEKYFRVNRILFVRKVNSHSDSSSVAYPDLKYQYALFRTESNEATTDALLLLDFIFYFIFIMFQKTFSW
jgi:hypothetical protein